MRKPQSNGTIGEQAAEICFKEKGWKMYRHQPPTKVVQARGRVFTVPCKSDGIADYTGYRMVPTLHGDRPYYLACEVKEAEGERMPCSRLKEAQRDWMNAIPKESAFVGVCWMNRFEFEVFPFQYAGSYKRGDGIWRKKF